jgi:hypothetical protein
MGDSQRAGADQPTPKQFALEQLLDEQLLLEQLLLEQLSEEQLLEEQLSDEQLLEEQLSVEMKPSAITFRVFPAREANWISPAGLAGSLARCSSVRDWR